MTKAHKYKLTLSPDEVEAIRFVASRGYAEAMLDAIMHEETLTEPNDPATDYYIPEWLAWGVAEELETNGGHGFGPLASDLTTKLYAFVDAII